MQLEDIATKRALDERMETFIFDAARNFLVSNRDKVSTKVREDIKSAGGVRGYLRPYISEQVAQIYMKFDAKALKKASELESAITEQQMCLQSLDLYTK